MYSAICFRCFCVTLSLILAAPASAQDRREAAAPPGSWLLSEWAGQASFGVTGNARDDAPLNFGDIRDDSTLSFFVRGTRPIVGPISLRLEAGAGATPSFFDDDDAKSNYYLQVSLGEADDNLTRFLALTDAETIAEAAVQDRILPFLRHRFTQSFKGPGLFSGEEPSEHQTSLGMRFRDVRGVMCEGEEIAASEVNTDTRRICQSATGLYLEFTPSVALVDSSDPNRDRIVPAFTGQIVSRPVLYGFRFFGEAHGEISFYRTERSASGQKGEDRTRRFTAGVMLGTPVQRWIRSRGGFFSTIDADVRLAVRYQRVASTNPERRQERFSFVPSITLTQNF